MNYVWNYVGSLWSSSPSIPDSKWSIRNPVVLKEEDDQGF